MIKGSITGDKELIKRLKAAPDLVRKEIGTTVQKLGFELIARVQRDKLSGQVLRAPTGRLRASISPLQQIKSGDTRSRYEENGTQIYYYVGTNVEYAAAWEYGSQARTILPKKGKALKFTVGGKEIFSKRVFIPARGARPFLAPALREMASLIKTQLKNALVRAARSLKP